MRVTDNTNFETVRGSIARSRQRMEDLQMKSASLKKLNTPSDDPVGSAKVLETRTDKVNNDQFLMNAKMAETFLANTDHTLSELSEIALRAKEIALNQANGSSSNEDSRLAVVEEISQLFQQAVASANRRIGDRYILGGYKTNQAPVDADGRYTGDSGQMMVEVAKDVFVSMNIPGIEAFNTSPKSSVDGQRIYKDLSVAQRAPAGTGDLTPGESANGENVNLFNELQNLRIALLTGDQDGIRNTLERFDSIHGKLTAVRAKVGSRINGLSNTSQAIERHNVTNAQLTSSLEDADMVQVMSDLSREETVLRSTLGSSKHLMQPTLLDFLK